MSYTPQVDYSTRSTPRSRAAAPSDARRDHADRRQDRASGRRGRPARRARRAHRAGLVEQRRRRARRGGHRRRQAASRPRSARCPRPIVRSPHRRTRASASTVVARRDLRPLSAEVGVIPTAHGSGLFQRGETQVLNVATLGMPRMDQMIDGIDPVTRKRYMHHYNFPPFSTGETGFMRGPKRREIGHGVLAERALLPVRALARGVRPTRSASSPTCWRPTAPPRWRSVCGSTLSMMDAGVPIKAPGRRHRHGPRLRRRQVHHPHRHPRCRGRLRRHGLQGRRHVRVRHRAAARHQDRRHPRRRARRCAATRPRRPASQILEVMAGAIAEPRDEVGETAPKIISFEIPIDKIGEVIGPEGQGHQRHPGRDRRRHQRRRRRHGRHRVASAPIDARCGGTRPSVRSSSSSTRRPPRSAPIYTGRVVNITKFGAFVNILPGRDGLLHISKIGGGKRIDRVEDVLDLGDAVRSVSTTSTPTARSPSHWWTTPPQKRVRVTPAASPTPQPPHGRLLGRTTRPPATAAS